MITKFQHAPILARRPLRRLGFTLLEIVIVLSLIALLVAAAVPSFSGIQEERQLREPLIQLSQLAKEVRLLAMKEKRPYQIVFTAQGFQVSRFLSPTLQLAEFQSYLLEQQHLIEEKHLEKAPVPESVHTLGFTKDDLGQVMEPYQLAERQFQQFQYWYESTPTDVVGSTVKLWVFQPSGLCEPIKIRFQSDRSYVEATFTALTADIMQESSGKL